MQMLTSMTKFATRRDYSLDTIKALATICVVFVHASNLYGYSNSESLLINQIYGFFGKFAALGVPLFFVVSGYLASMQYQPGFVWYKENLKKKNKDPSSSISDLDFGLFCATENCTWCW